ncbi:hypothetical protein C7974DRAFT_414949 [Boeremia exigua]|uniref:uncharacterized protein n=1 Tax=Boeremia exigua TaxID=749465 RepID=UPI001E8D8255|nr:uncharacterized protein C7974DRAFT_414949 [Boeremia exigua]KAH6622296.1 hypothetical protein C7974DRAFT_414949 [Boeremia exigua]
MEPIPTPTTGSYSPQHRDSISQPAPETSELLKVLHRIDSADDARLNGDTNSTGDEGSETDAHSVRDPPTPRPAPRDPLRREDAYAAQRAATRELERASRWSMVYMCLRCEARDRYRQTEPVRCKTCGTEMLLKVRTARMVQFEAR